VAETQARGGFTRARGLVGVPRLFEERRVLVERSRQHTGLLRVLRVEHLLDDRASTPVALVRAGGVAQKEADAGQAKQELRHVVVLLAVGPLPDAQRGLEVLLSGLEASRGELRIGQEDVAVRDGRVPGGEFPAPDLERARRELLRSLDVTGAQGPLP